MAMQISALMLAVRSGYSGCWQDVARDPHGRAIAGTVSADNGVAVRFVAVYGPVGACLPGFTNPASLNVEASLKSFLDTQIELAVSSQTLLIVGGDLTSSCSNLDHWEGSYVLRPGCIAAHLGHRGLLDTFRMHHPTLRLYLFSCQPPGCPVVAAVPEFGGAGYCPRRADQSKS